MLIVTRRAGAEEGMEESAGAEERAEETGGGELTPALALLQVFLVLLSQLLPLSPR